MPGVRDCQKLPRAGGEFREFARLMLHQIFRRDPREQQGRELLQPIARAIDLNNVEVEIEFVVGLVVADVGRSHGVRPDASR